VTSKRSGVDPATANVHIGLTLTGVDAARFRQQMAQTGLGVTMCARAVLAAALADGPLVAQVVKAVRLSMLWEFKRALYTEFTNRLMDFANSVRDEANALEQHNSFEEEVPDANQT
jgi:hypothetical protein